MWLVVANGRVRSKAHTRRWFIQKTLDLDDTDKSQPTTLRVCVNETY